MGKPLLKVAVNFISLPRTSVAVTGMVFVRITGDADSLRTAEFKAIPNAAASRPCANPLYLIILPKFSGGEKGRNCTPPQSRRRRSVFAIPQRGNDFITETGEGLIET